MDHIENQKRPEGPAPRLSVLRTYEGLIPGPRAYARGYLLTALRALVTFYGNAGNEQNAACVVPLHLPGQLW